MNGRLARTLRLAMPALCAALLAGALAAGCEYPFEPFQENVEGPFTILGYLDLKADTQWVRVTPVRQNVSSSPDPIDAVVTLEHVESGRTVTLRDSLSVFPDPALGTAGYAHNFWTTERLEPEATYRLTALRSDGASSSAVIEMPPALEFSFLNFGRDNAVLKVRADHLLFVEVFYTMLAADGQRAVLTDDGAAIIAPDGPGIYSVFIDAGEIFPEGLKDMRRLEIRLGVARSDWPYHPDLSDLEVSLPGTMPSNVENGFGFVGGVATWKVPFHRCAFGPAPPDVVQSCTTTFNASSASIVGRVVREPEGCAHALMDLHLTERLANGDSMTRRWRTGFDGEYRFDGVQPGAELTLDVFAGTPPVRLPALEPGQRYVVDDIAVAWPC